MKYIILLLVLGMGLLQSSFSASIVQSFSNNTIGVLNNGDTATITANPNFTSSDLANATQLDITLTLTGDAHLFLESLSNVSRQHAAQLLSQVSFSHINTSSPLFSNLDSAEITSLDESPFVSVNASGDTTSVFAPNPLDYTVSWSTVDISQINNLNATTLDFEALVSHRLGVQSELNVLFGQGAYSNLRFEDASATVDFTLTTAVVPEPTSSLLVSSSLFLFLLRRKR